LKGEEMTKAPFTIAAPLLKRGLILLAACFCVALVCSISFHAFPVHAESYGSWDTIPSHNGVDFRVRCDCGPGSGGGSHLWWVQFHNRYNEKVAFDFRITRPGERPAGFSDRVSIAPGDMQEGWNSVDVPYGGTVEVWTENWKTGANAD
jgi:hypothetical protein